MESIGIAKLDGILKGGVPDKSVTLIEGTPGIGKDVLAYHFLFSGIKAGEACAFVFVGRTIEEIVSEFAANGMAISPQLFTWIDASGPHGSDGSNVVNCDISELFTVSSAIKSFVEKNKKKKMRLVFSILSPALMSNNSAEVYKFLSALIGTLKKSDITAVMLIEDGMHDPQTVVSIEQLCDGVIDMKAYEKDWEIQTMLRIKKMRSLPTPPRYFRFSVTDRGISLESE